MTEIAITGAAGLIGRHAAARLHAANCAARFRGETAPHGIRLIDRTVFADPTALQAALAGAERVLHFAGVNRDTEERQERGNIELAEALVAGLKAANAAPTVVYANSPHAARDTAYGRGKRRAGEILSEWARGADTAYAELVIPHVFGEGGRPFYNNVTGTFCHQAAAGASPEIDPEGRVALIHAGAVADAAISAEPGSHVLEGRPMGVKALWEKISGFAADYGTGIFPDLSDPFDRSLFNTYRTVLFPDRAPQALRLNRDARGTLYETAKGGGGGQSFVSWTVPGVTRGDHFHLDKVERFVVIEGAGVIRIRRVLDDKIHEFRVSGAVPTAIDMPTLHTHSIENTGSQPLVTLFWADEIFDRDKPDTYADPVLAPVSEAV